MTAQCATGEREVLGGEILTTILVGDLRPDGKVSVRISRDAVIRCSHASTFRALSDAMAAAARILEQRGHPELASA